MANVTNELRLNKVPAQSPFVPGTSIQFAWDSTSLTTILSCPQRYKLGIIEGWTPKNPGVAIALAFGILMHSGVEEFHRQRSAGCAYDEAIHNALWFIYTRPEFAQLPTEEEITEAKEEQEDDDDGISLRNAKVRTRYHLMRALVWYFDRYRNEQMPVLQLADGTPAVEHSFRVSTGRNLSDGTELLISGHMDRVVVFNDQTFVVDLKTGKGITRQYKEGFNLSHQMTGYTLGGKVALEQPVAGVFIDAVALQVGGVKFDRFPTYRSQSQLLEYIDLVEHVGFLSEFYFTHDYYPLNTAACMFCEYKEVCSKPPELRHGYLNHFYERRPPWNPLQNR